MKGLMRSAMELAWRSEPEGDLAIWPKLTAIPRPGPINHPVKRCGGLLRLLTTLPRTSDHPSCRMFGCTSCNSVNWQAETAR